MKRKLKSCLPPGTELKSELIVCLALWAIVVGISMSFLSEYREAYEELYWGSGSSRTLMSGARMADLDTLLAGKFIGIYVLFAGCVVLTVLHYMSFYKDSRSIYVMKRLESPFELHKRCLVLPLICLLAGILLTLFTMWIYLMIYYNFTPKECLPSEIHFIIWRSIVW